MKNQRLDREGRQDPERRRSCHDGPGRQGPTEAASQAEASRDEKELTDEEFAAIAGGPIYVQYSLK